PLLGKWCIGKKLVPPDQQTAAGLAHRVVAAQRNPIRTVVSSVEQIGDVSGEIIRCWHSTENTKTGCSPQANLFFPAKSGKKRVLQLCKFTQVRQTFSSSCSSSSSFSIIGSSITKTRPMWLRRQPRRVYLSPSVVNGSIPARFPAST